MVGNLEISAYVYVYVYMRVGLSGLRGATGSEKVTPIIKKGELTK